MLLRYTDKMNQKFFFCFWDSDKIRLLKGATKNGSQVHLGICLWSYCCQTPLFSDISTDYVNL